MVPVYLKVNYATEGLISVLDVSRESLKEEWMGDGERKGEGISGSSFKA